MIDAIDTLAGIAPGSSLDALRRRKPITRDNAQASFDALFAPAAFDEMSAVERCAVALFVAALHQDSPAIAFYRDMLQAAGPPPGSIVAILAAAEGAGAGPYGHFPPGPLSAEDSDGPAFDIPASHQETLGPRLFAAVAHAHMLVMHPRDAAPDHLRALEAANWSATGIVILSQLVAFLAFQIRAAHGLRALAASPA